ncbi:potassium channel protein [Thermosipho melanesiensis]|uniref:TrkA-N domain protein n=2 Tax=Thermosipho melanesiensis TaxID=46541 RepID=A6LNH7_THEM4|nr:potassium channel protein [Thermosipho melanesiensis]ABR31478.1 TrkA-N domain protein [Thermosipho melanesiensis BI429]APT74536.1 potassium channel protein [Thermosipho melanesiensis]OOC36487.1 potassium channel protein [Thermosipho melanesiensis]OOC37305.1 potassium channel protein [Thermosipho melanesiensis]OOC38058.1 potassium channel protein [Thermosipho melanesiensis]
MNENIGKLLIKQIILFSILIIAIVSTGVLYYHYVEGLSFVDAFFFTAITISTVGYSMPETLSNTGRIFTSILIFMGISVVLYGVSSVTAIVVEGKLSDYMKERRNRKMIERLENHIIVVGAGKTGQYVIAELIREKEKFLIIDNKEENIKKLLEMYNIEVPYVIGDAAEEDILLNSGIMKARALITTLPEDSVNVFVVLSARTLNPNLTIISKVTDVSSIRKLIYAGATTVVAAAEIAGTRMARLITRPESVNFVDLFAFGNEQYRIEEVKVNKNSGIVDKKISDLDVGKKFNVLILAINRFGDIIFGPSGNVEINNNDVLMIMGKKDNIDKFKEFVKA